MRIFTFIFLFFISFQFSVAQKLMNPNATLEAQKLKKILDSIYGKKILSGQMDEAYLQYIIDNTGGKSPAIMGYDFNGICPSQSGNNDAEKAIKWVKEKGGIAQFQWHWISPDANGDFYTKNFSLENALKDTENNSYKNMLRDIDLVANEIKKMQDAGVPILWRPLHEAEGAWFWWGMSGGNACKKLWNLIYDRFTNYHQLNNIIWIWNSYGTQKENWYPGDATVDIIAFDYPDYNQNSGAWSQYQSMFKQNGKLFGVAEDGKLTDPNILVSQTWLYFLTWSYMINEPSQTNGKNTKDWLFQVYNDSRVMTLDDLTSGPKAYAGNAQLLFDLDGNGTEQVTLDGSKSFVNNGTISTYSWAENNTILSTEMKPTISLPIGRHVIKLTVTTNTNQSKTASVVVTVKTVSITHNKPVTVSSSEPGSGNFGSKGVDGDESTRWSSEYSDPQWYQIDLGKKYKIDKIIINWEAASGKEYNISESNDGQTWTVVVTKSNMPNGARVDTIKNLKGGGQYIRLWGSERTTKFGFSFFEFEAYGIENPNALPGTDIQTGLNDLGSDKLNLFPTILTGEDTINIESVENLNQAILSIIDLNGKIVMSKIVNGTLIQIPVQNSLAKGIYNVRLQTTKTILSSKIIVK